MAASTATTHGNAYGVDAQGEPVLLSSSGQQVMMAWERQYMERCVDALRVRSSDSVLEIGFGLAYSATRLQHFRPTRHTIIECDATVLQHARAFASQHAGVEILAGTWQCVLPTLDSSAFDCVFFDDYPLPELDDDSTSTEALSMRRSRWHDFLDVVLDHVRPGARITGYLARPLDLARDGCTVEMTPMRVLVSATCNYYSHREALVPVITVVDPVRARASTRHLQRERLDRVRQQLLFQEILADANEDAEDQALQATAELEVDDESGSVVSPWVNSSPTEEARDGSTYAGFPSRKAYLMSLRSRARVAVNMS